MPVKKKSKPVPKTMVKKPLDKVQQKAKKKKTK